ncbi:hypothetical protein H072_7743 [Dactylellina haptotyla CBS 200.50]|uniref:Zn(2)-C6 fungal-type domain-containing protein n=1 Tax=Dactylellina haptotyla (strain CBS 200.50) TaxID=1284197 RepID=S8BTD4_DACHA|nr:hypothetical protein H072_7743 [Dactylellina haptotyla CBS 200.50]
MQPKVQKTASKTHKRSRTGCFTCRLRRKKCDEGKPVCRACKHLGLSCDYKRPSWWGNVEHRRRQKEVIKLQIKKTKVTEKAANNAMASMSVTAYPSSVSQSTLPTPEYYFDGMPRPVRSHSVDSGYSLEYDYEQQDPSFDKMQMAHPTQVNFVETYDPNAYPYNGAYPNILENKSQSFLNAMPVDRRENTAAFCGPQRKDSGFPGAILPSMPAEMYPATDLPTPPLHPSVILPSQNPTPGEDIVDFNFVDFNSCPESVPINQVNEDDQDQQLLNHFVINVLPSIFPVLDLNVPYSQNSFIAPALGNNPSYLHSCLAVAAMHIKATEQNIDTAAVDEDIMRHRKSTVERLCEAMNLNVDPVQPLEAILSVIALRAFVASVHDNLPDVPWHQHFEAAITMIQQMNLTSHFQELTSSSPNSAFNMALAAWIDILGSTMQGQFPALAHEYCENFKEGKSAGLKELMGCDDKVMYLISEITCLEYHKLYENLPDATLLGHITSLSASITSTETEFDPVVAAQNGPIDPTILSGLITAAYRYAARIYLTTLMPAYQGVPFNHNVPAVIELVDKLTTVLELIPTGDDGFDRSLSWVYLIGGSVATPGSAFRTMLQTRFESLPQELRFGSFVDMYELVNLVWREADAIGTYVPWRTVMRNNEWDILLL